jgi:hypothetical protein
MELHLHGLMSRWGWTLSPSLAASKVIIVLPWRMLHDGIEIAGNLRL